MFFLLPLFERKGPSYRFYTTLRENLGHTIMRLFSSFLNDLDKLYSFSLCSDIHSFKSFSMSWIVVYPLRRYIFVCVCVFFL